MITKLLGNKRLQYLLLLILFIPAFASLVRPGYFPMHDDIQGMRLLQMDKCIRDLQIPCRWVPDMGYGYGYPQFNYYGPLPYYVLEPFVLLGASILETVKVGFALSAIVSGLGMYLLGKKLWGKAGGVLSALLYVYAPYRAVDMYVRGAVGEFWALAFLPFIVYFSVLVLEGKRKYILWLTLSFAGLFMSHNITTLIFAPFYGLFLLLYMKPSMRRYVDLILSAVWGIGISAFFLAPAFFEKNLVHIETITQGYFNYLAHFVGARQLLFSTFWGYGVSELGPLDGMSLSVGVLLWLLPLFTLCLLLYLKKKKELRLVALLLVIGVIGLFMVHPKSQFIWDFIGILEFVQFPWRFLTISTFAFSLAGGVVMTILKTYRAKELLLGILYLVIIFMFGSFFTPKSWLNIDDQQKFSGNSWMQQQTISIFDYLPKSAAHPPTAPAPSEPVAIDGEIEVLLGEKGTNWQNWEIIAESVSTVEMPIFVFPNLSVKVDGQEVLIDNNNELGLPRISLPKGTSRVEVRLQDTPIRTISNFVSLFALLLIPIFLKYESFSKK